MKGKNNRQEKIKFVHHGILVKLGRINGQVIPDCIGKIKKID